MPRHLIRPLHWALVAEVIDGNPSLLGGGENDNRGHQTMSADNAMVYGHPLHGGNHYVTSTGAMVQKLDVRSAFPGRPLPKIPPPRDLPTPLFPSFDAEYAAAVYESLLKDDQAARRLDRTIDWLTLAWNNATEITAGARVLVYRAAFEVLLGGGASTPDTRTRLSDLLDPQDVARRPRSWPGMRQAVDLSDLEWWFQSFALLRNKVAHGDLVEDDDWHFDDGEHHIRHANEVLRRAIKAVVIGAGHDPDLALAPVDRMLRRAYRGHE